MSTTASPAAPVAVSSVLPHRPPWAVFAVAGALALLLFAPTFAKLVQLWERDPNYSHGYLIGPICLFLAYTAYRRVGPPVRGELRLGLFGVTIGVLLQLATGVVQWPPLSFLGMLFVFRGLLVCAGGRVWASAFTFPLLFLFFMFPLPVTWTGYAALWLQDIVSKLSETIISLFVVCHRVGHTIRIAGVDNSLVVAEECSGLRQIVAFLAFAALLGYLLARPVWYRVVLVVGAIPVAIAANVLRVTLMNMGAYWFGTKWMGGTLHDAPALFSIPVGLALFLLFDRVLWGMVERKQTPDSAAPAPTPATPPTPAPAAAWNGRPLRAAIAALAVGVVAQFALAQHLKAAGELSFPTTLAPFDTLPLEFRNPETGAILWEGEDFAEQREATRVKLGFPVDDLLIRGYINPNKYLARAYMVYSRAGEDRKHHPEICVRDVSGAPEDLPFRKTVPLSADGTRQAARFRFITGVGQSVVVFYWHYTLTPNADPGRSKLQDLHQRIGVTAPSITVQVSMPGDNPKEIEAVEKQLLPLLDAAARDRILPAGTEEGCNRLPMGLVRQ